MDDYLLYADTKFVDKELLGFDKEKTWIVDLVKEADHSFELKIYKIIAWDAETNEPYYIEPYLQAYIRWDGDSNFLFDERTLNFGCLQDYEEHCALMYHIWKLGEQKWEGSQFYI